MKKILFSLVVFVMGIAAIAQQRPGAPVPPPQQSPAPAPSSAPDPRFRANDIPFNPDHSVTADHEITIKGVKVPYKTVTGMMPVWDTEGKVQAGVFYTYYERSDVKDRAARPLLISFNGGIISTVREFHPGSVPQRPVVARRRDRPPERSQVR
ncbi:MAG: hypothetical protein ACKO03_07815 [Bacteroidota bacterium]